MSEAQEIATNMLRRAGDKPTLGSIDQARDWVKAQWPDWSDWIGNVMLDNIAEAIFHA